MKSRKKANVFVSVFLAMTLIISSFSSFGMEKVFAAEAWEKMENSIAYMVDTPTALINNELVYADPMGYGKKPMIINDSTMVPIEFIQNGTDATDFEYSDDGADVSFKMGDSTYKFTLDSNTYTVNNKSVETLIAPTSVESRMYVPVRLLADLSQKELFYNDGLIILSETTDIYDPMAEKDELSQIKNRLNQLPVIGTKEKFIELAGTPEDGYDDDYPIPTVYDLVNQSIPFNIAESLRWQNHEETMHYEEEMAYEEYSYFNVPYKNNTEGVDEGNSVLNDGEYIYSLAGEASSLQVFKASPADEMQLIYTDEYNNEKYNSDIESDNVGIEYVWPTNMFLDENYLTVILTGDKINEEDMYTPITMVKVYDISDKSNITVSKEYTVDGYSMYTSKIGNELYVVTGLDLYYLSNGTEYILPTYYDSVVGEEKEITYDQITYFPLNSEYYSKQLNIVSAIKIDEPETAANISANFSEYYNGLTFSTENMYIAVPDFGYIEEVAYYEGTDSNIYKYSLNDGNIQYENQCNIDGEVWNDSYMNEYNGNLRVVADIYDDEGNYSMGINVLDSDLNVIGQTECFIGEISSVMDSEFFGDKLYLVPDVTEQPVQVIDLQNPESPEVVGELTIPGKSNVLYPYDTNHTIGFSFEKENPEDETSKEVAKMTMYDTTDIYNPVALFSQVIGDEGTYSNLLYDRNAILIDPEKNLLALQVNAYEEVVDMGADVVAEEVTDSATDGGTTEMVEATEEGIEVVAPEEGIEVTVEPSAMATEVVTVPQQVPAGDMSGKYKGPYENETEFVFQGVYVYDVNFENGFTKKGEITHMTDEDINDESNYEGDYGKHIFRVINIGDVLYTISSQYIRATDMNTFEEISQISIFEEEVLI